jgi:nucleoside-diphosphate-sugar epimerase
MNRILVTGGAGFLGSHLCERLLERGHDVLWVDNYFTGSKANIAHLYGTPRFEVMRHDVTFLYGDGAQTRSFCYVDDLIEAMQRMMATAEEITGRCTSVIQASFRCSNWPRR